MFIDFPSASQSFSFSYSETFPLLINSMTFLMGSEINSSAKLQSLLLALVVSAGAFDLPFSFVLFNCALAYARHPAHM